MPTKVTTVTPEYKAWDYETLAKPLEQMTQYYDAIDTAQQKIGAEAGALGDLLTPADPFLRHNYNEFMGELTAARDSLLTKGELRKGEKAVGDLQQKYATHVAPIKKASEYRAKMVEDFDKDMDKSNGSMLYEYDPRMLSLDSIYRSGYNIRAPRWYSGEKLLSEFRDMVSRLQNVDFGGVLPTDEQWDKILGSVFGDKYYQAVSTTGITPYMVLQEIMSDNKDGLFNKLARLKLASTGIGQWGSDATIAKAMRIMAEGFWNAVGSDRRVTLGAAGAGGDGKDKTDETPDLWKNWSAVLEPLSMPVGSSNDGMKDKNYEKELKKAKDDLKTVQTVIETIENNPGEYPEGKIIPNDSGIKNDTGDAYEKVNNIYRQFYFDEDGNPLDWDGDVKSLSELEIELWAKSNMVDYKSYKFKTSTQAQVNRIGNYLLNDVRVALSDLLAAATTKDSNGKELFMTGPKRSKKKEIGLFLTYRVNDKGVRHYSVKAAEAAKLLKGEYNSVGFDPYYGKFLYFMNDGKVLELDAHYVKGDNDFIIDALFGKPVNGVRSGGLVNELRNYFKTGMDRNEGGDEVFSSYWDGLLTLATNIFHISEAFMPSNQTTSGNALDYSYEIGDGALAPFYNSAGQAYGGAFGDGRDDGYDEYTPFFER